MADVVNNGVNVDALISARDALTKAPEAANSNGALPANGRTAPTATRRSRVSSAWARSSAARRPSSSMPTIPRSSPRRTWARRPSNMSWSAWRAV